MGTPYKIVIIGPAYPLRGGLATFDELLCREFNKEGHKAEIVSFSLQYPGFLFPGSTQYDTSGKAPGDIKIHTLINSVNPFSWLKTARFIKKQQPHFVFIRYWIPFMGPALGSIARLVRKKGIKIIALTDNVIPHEKRPGDPAFTRYFIRACDGFVTMSKAVMKDLSLFTASSHKTFLVHPLYTAFGEKVNRQEARKIMGVGETDRMVLFFGLIRKYKGLDMLLEAMANERIKKAGIKLLVAGEFYEDRSEYDKLIHTLGIEQQVILHTRFIANEEVKNYFSACNLVALPYRSATQSGVTQVAFHFEQPVLVTNVGGLNEIIPHGKAGYVVESNAEAIANAVLDFFENKREEAFTEGMKQEKQKYDWRIFVNGITALYEKL